MKINEIIEDFIKKINLHFNYINIIFNYSYYLSDNKNIYSDIFILNFKFKINDCEHGSYLIILEISRLLNGEEQFYNDFLNSHGKDIIKFYKNSKRINKYGEIDFKDFFKKLRLNRKLKNKLEIKETKEKRSKL